MKVAFQVRRQIAGLNPGQGVHAWCLYRPTGWALDNQRSIKQNLSVRTAHRGWLVMRYVPLNHGTPPKRTFGVGALYLTYSRRRPAGLKATHGQPLMHLAAKLSEWLIMAIDRLSRTGARVRAAGIFLCVPHRACSTITLI